MTQHLHHIQTLFLKSHTTLDGHLSALAVQCNNAKRQLHNKNVVKTHTHTLARGEFSRRLPAVFTLGISRTLFRLCTQELAD